MAKEAEASSEAGTEESLLTLVSALRQSVQLLVCGPQRLPWGKGSSSAHHISSASGFDLLLSWAVIMGFQHGGSGHVGPTSPFPILLAGVLGILGLMESWGHRI